MVRLKIAYWEFDFEAVCPTLDHNLLSKAHIQSTETIRRIREEEGEERGYAGGGRGKLYIYHYTVTTRMTPALRRAAVRSILMFL